MIDLPTPEILDRAPRSFVGLAEDFDLSRRAEIPALFDRFLATEGGIEGKVSDDLYGISFNATPDGRFSYAVANEVIAPRGRPEGFCTLYASPGLYAVFRQRAPMAELPDRFDAVFSDWLPGSDFARRAGAVLERYPAGEPVGEGVAQYEFWVPVAPKPAG